MKAYFPLSADGAGWKRLYMLGVCAALVIYAADVFLRPFLLGTSDVVIHDDARQFLTWMPRLVDAHALQGDWMADFWEAVSPPAYQLIFKAGALIGLHPTLLARLLPMPLLLASAWAGWRLARAMGLQPPVAFLAAGFLMALLLKEDSIFSATPRGLAVPFMLFFIDALVRDKWRVMMVCLIALSVVYPAPAVVLWTMLGLSRLRLRGGFCLADGWRDIVRVGALGGVIMCLMLLFREQSDGWGPVLTMGQARELPGLMSAGGRSAIVDASGGFDYLCSMRMGFLPEIAPCGREVPFATLINILFLAPLLWLAATSLGKQPGQPGYANRIYLWALIAALAWFVMAHILAFRLHLPSRYSQRLLYPLEWLAIGQVIGQWLYYRFTEGTARLGVRLASGFAGAFVVISFLSPLALLRTPDDPAMIRHIRTLPADSRISGLSTSMDFVPSLTGRAITGSPQHAIPWQFGYFQRVMAGLQDSVIIRTTLQPDQLRQALERTGGTHVLLAKPMDGEDLLPEEYEGVIPATALAVAKTMADRDPLLFDFIEACRTAETARHYLLLTECIEGRLSQAQVSGQ